MSQKESKDFGPIHADHAFFEMHATEAAEDVRAYAPHVRSLAAKTERLRMLDFGCGPGRFTARFLEVAGLARDRLSLSLVEPDPVYRRQAVERLQALTSHPILAWPALPRSSNIRFDLVLANHVLYYVPDLEEVMSGILRALATPGVFVAAIAGQRNTLIQFWNRCFALMGKPVPFHTAEDLEAALDRLGEAHGRRDVQYELVFEDSEENRMKILRFLLGEYMRELPRQALLGLFDPHVHGGQIVIRPVHEHFVICRRGTDTPASPPAMA